LALGIALLVAWEGWVRIAEIPDYKLRAPSAVAATLRAEFAVLSSAWLVTLKTMLAALVASVVLGTVLAAALTSSRLVEVSLFPYAVMLQVTPLVAVAPFIVIWLGWERVWLTQIVCASIVAFFPIVSNTAMGLRSADRGLNDLFELYGATRWQRLGWLLAPSALPYFLAGLKVSANLALVGAVVAEFVIGTQVDQPGLASLIFESQLRSDAPTMFAALALVSLTGIVTFFAMQGLSYALLRRWHESALE
jgi:NitT/TauT family transport system permease protein